VSRVNVQEQKQEMTSSVAPEVTATFKDFRFPFPILVGSGKFINLGWFLPLFGILFYELDLV